MSVLEKLAVASGRNDEKLNIQLAEEIVKKKDKKAVGELVEGLLKGTQAVRSDCIKTLYETGERNPALIAKHLSVFGDLVSSKNNRLAWGAMTAIDAIAAYDPQPVAAMLPRLADAAEKGSVITRDHYVGVLVKLAADKKHEKNCSALLLEQLKTCPSNQLPMYAENSIAVFLGKNKREFMTTIASRMKDLQKESQRKRLEKVLKKLA